MLYFDGVFGLALLALWLFCLFDVITTDASRCRHLPKLVWVLIVLLLFDIGSILWLVAGRTWDSAPAAGLPYKGNTGLPRQGSTGRYPEYERPGRRVASNPDDDEDFLRQLRERAEQQRHEYRAQRAEDVERDERERRRRSGDEPN